MWCYYHYYFQYLDEYVNNLVECGFFVKQYLNEHVNEFCVSPQQAGKLRMVAAPSSLACRERRLQKGEEL